MIGIVRIALSRPLTFIVMAILILILGVLSALRLPVDIFPNIRLPVIAIAWTYNGLSPEDMAGRVITPYERALNSTVNDIEHIESQSLPGMGIVKIFFHPGADIPTATSQVVSVSQTMLRSLPPGIAPPFVVNYNAATVPILQLALSGQGLSEGQMFDLGVTQIRPPLVTIPGAALPYPYGGSLRQIQIDIDPVALQAKGLAAQDVSNALAAQTQITPAGFVKVGDYQYAVRLNNAPGSPDELNDLPIKVVGGATIHMRDVAHVRDGSSPQTNVVHVDGSRSVLMSILKIGATSTLSIVQGVKEALPAIQQLLPESMKVVLIGDQSLFVKAAVEGVIFEGAIAAALTSLMILLFLGSWRSTVIVAVSIPLSVLAAIAALAATGNTLNIMTLGGLSLAVGILVDEATVTIENINWHLEQGKPVLQAIFDGAQQIVTPAFVSLLSICIVFVPMFFLPGVSGFLFVPLALSVIFAMVASFLLSRTLVPTMAMFLLKPHAGGQIHETGASRSRNPLILFQRGFETRFKDFRDAYLRLLEQALSRPKAVVALFLLAVVLSMLLLPYLGRNFFPAVDAGAMALHVRAPIGTRIEDTSAQFDRIERRIREIIPAHELVSVVDNIGQPYSIINSVYNNSGTTGPQDGDILIQLAKGHAPTEGYMRKLREELPKAFPGTQFAFLPADITAQILNFGTPAPIDIRIQGPNAKAGEAYARKILRRIRAIPGVVDARIQQSTSYPQLSVTVDRSRVAQFGLSERDVTNSLATSLAGTSQAAPVYYLNPQNGVTYPVVAQMPERMISSLGDLANIPVSGATSSASQILGGLGTIARSSTAAVVTHYNIAPSINIFAGIAGRDLGAVAEDINRLLAEMQSEAPKATKAVLGGQYVTMATAFSGLGFGLLGAIVLIYLLIVVNFQSWLDPFVIITALPGAMAGIIWMLFLSNTSLSVPALIGAIMCMGVATANSILVVSFARERLNELGDAVKAALESGQVRFRPVLMTALAMIIGMVPMALGLGDGGEQNAPLGRAVIGGLLVATFATLMFVPVIFSLVHGRKAPGLWNWRKPMSERRLSRPGLGGIILVAGALVAAGTGIVARGRSETRLAAWTTEQAIPTVALIRPTPLAAAGALALPATLQPLNSAPIQARTTGYLRERFVDIGDTVRQGQVLALLEAPELEQQLAAAQADLRTARANQQLAATTAARWNTLLEKEVVSKQAADEKRADLAAKSAVAGAAQANVERLTTLAGFTRLTAPFDGVVINRSAEIGALVSPGTPGSAPLFTIADISRIRASVRIPQLYSAQVQPGMEVKLSLPEFPGRGFTATVTRSAGAVDPISGTVLVELQADNAERLLKPGAYVQAAFPLTGNDTTVTLPPSALIMGADGPRVAVVDAGSKALLRPVTLGRDRGKSMEVITGLSAVDEVINNPPDSLLTGDPVRVAKP